MSEALSYTQKLRIPIPKILSLGASALRGRHKDAWELGSTMQAIYYDTNELRSSPMQFEIFLLLLSHWEVIHAKGARH